MINYFRLQDIRNNWPIERCATLFQQASQELVQADIELVGPLQVDELSGNAWQHFCGPDGKLYELTYNQERDREPPEKV